MSFARAVSMQRLQLWARRPALPVFLVVTAGYALLAWERLPNPSPQFHFVDLAHSFLAGRLDTETPELRPERVPDDAPRGLREAVRRTLDSGGWNDWASIETLKLKDGTVLRGRFPFSDDEGEKRHLFHTTGNEEWKVDVRRDLANDCGDSGRRRCEEKRHHVSFPPFPALVMLPFAAIWGYDTNDVLVTVLLGGLNAALLFVLLELLTRRGHSTRGTRENLWLTFLFAFGSVAFFSSVRGEVWFTALVVGVTLHLAFLLAALDLRHPLLAGLALGAGMATRTPLAFCAIFFGWQLLFPGGRLRRDGWGDAFRKGLLFALPILAIGGALCLYNLERFDSPFEFGHAYLSGGAGKRIREHGLFSTWYLNQNLQAAILNVPRILTEPPWIQITKHGLGLLVTTPALVLLFRPKAMPPLHRALWLSVTAAAVPGLLYQNTGWEQFGYRFALDYFPYLVLLLAVGARPFTWRVKALVLAGVAVNLFGAITFGRFPNLYY